MRICVPTVGQNGLEENVHSHFGSAEFFTIYDTELNNVEIISNANQHDSHGACEPLRALAGYNIDVVLTCGMGSRAVAKFNDGGIKVYLFQGSTVGDAIKRFQAGQLPELTSDMACQGHDCH